MKELFEAKNFYDQSARNFADFYLNFARTHAQDFDALAVEMSNIFTAIGLYDDLKVWAGTIEIVQAIDDFLDDHGFWEELVAVYHTAIESAENYFWSRGRKPEPKGYPAT